MNQRVQRKSASFAVALLTLSFSATSLMFLPAGAKSHFDKATAEPADENMKAGLIKIRQKNYEAAIDSFQQAIYFSRNQYNPEAWKLLGLCFKATRQYAKAVEALNKHLSQVTGPAPDARIDLAEVYLDIGDTDKARETIDKAFMDQDKGGTARQRYASGELYDKLGNPGEALQFFCTAIDEKPYYADAWMAKARTEVKLEDYNEALADYRTMLEKAMLIKPLNLEEIYYNMGTCLLKRGDHQGALDHWRMALEQNPDSYDAHLALASLFDGEKHVSSAIHEYEAAIRCMPANAPAKQQIARRLLYLEQQLKPKEAPIQIKPSPSMRKEFEDSVQQQRPVDNTPVPKDSGF